MSHPQNGSESAYDKFVNSEKYPRVSTCNPSVFSSMGKEAARRALSALSSAAMITRRRIGSLHNIIIIGADEDDGDDFMTTN